MARNHTNKKQNKHVLIPSIIACILTNVSLTKTSGISQPPVNKIADNVDIKTIEEYSPKKKKTKGRDECSVLKPDTNSDSLNRIYVLSLRIKYLPIKAYLIW